MTPAHPVHHSYDKPPILEQATTLNGIGCVGTQQRSRLLPVGKNMPVDQQA